MTPYMTLNTNRKLDLTEVKKIIYENIFPLLDSLELEYRQDKDSIFMSCPAHAGSDNQTGCSISLKYNRWHCWTHGCHDEYGKDIFGFIKGALQTDSFSEALKFINRVYNLDAAKGKLNVVEQLEDELSSIVRVFRSSHRYLNTNPIALIPTCGKSKYFEGRGFKPETLSLFEVEDCEDKSSPMKTRAIIPIKSGGLYIGYIARSTKDWVVPKYLFSEGFSKTEYLYNYDRAINTALKKNAIFVVEGQGDVWRMHESGVENCVGLFGRSISETQETLLVKSGVTNLIILTDNDSSGRESKIEIKRKLGRMFKLHFPKMVSKDIGAVSADKIRSTILPAVKGYY